MAQEETAERRRQRAAARRAARSVKPVVSEPTAEEIPALRRYLAMGLRGA